jgi:hypothetical protein
VSITVNDFDSGWRQFLMAGKWIRSVGFELRNVENRMDLAKGSWKPDCTVSYPLMGRYPIMGRSLIVGQGLTP